MIARFQAWLPFMVAIRSGDELPPIERDLDRYRIRIHPPYKSQIYPEDLLLYSELPIQELPRRLERETVPSVTQQLRYGGQPVVLADALQIDFLSEAFDRRHESDDPPSEMAFAVANELLEKLRVLSQSGQAQTIARDTVPWRISYLNDDESALEPDPQLKRTLASAHMRMSFLGLPIELWSAIGDLPEGYALRPSDRLFFDAVGLMREVGPSLVLAFSAIETHVGAVLDSLAAAAGVDPGVWGWIREREGDYRREPSIGEQLDVLLKWLSGRSLKERPRRWEGFQKLKKARNSFVHEGAAVVDGEIVTAPRAAELVITAGEILTWLDSMLPQEERRPSFSYPEYQIETTRLFAGVDSVEVSS